METRKAYICTTCLSNDRRLEPVYNIRNVLQDIKFTELEPSNTSQICWECKSHILNFRRFKIKALKAQAALFGNMRLEDMSSFSSLVLTVISEVVNNYQCFYDSDPLVNLDSQPKLENIVIKKELDDFSKNENVLNSTGNKKIVAETTDNMDSINIVEKSHDHANIIENDKKCKEIGTINNSFNSDNDENITENNGKIEGIVHEVENIDTMNSHKNKMITKKSKVDRELAGKFTRIVFSEEEIVQNREEKRNHYNFKKLPFKCDSCVLGFTRKETWNRHIEKKHDESIGPHKCDICAVRFARASALAGHRWKHYSCYRCRLCKYATTELWSALNHCKTKHKKDHLDKIHCTQCAAVVKTAGELEGHVQSEHSLRCNECGVKFKGKHTLRNHKARIHANKRDYICDICTKTFKSKTRLESHMAGHNTAVAKRLSYCQVCNVQYKNIQVYRNHLKNSANHSERNFSCPECNKKFASKVYWTKHYNFYHLHQSQFSCDVCDKLFISDWRLKNHRQIHHGLTRPRNHHCNICGKKFFSTSTLRNHLLIHSAQRSYMCEDCGDTFKQRPALYTHAKLVHGSSST